MRRDVIPLEPREGPSRPYPLNTRLECHGCGDCCQLLPLAISPQRLKEMESAAWRSLELWWPHKDASSGGYEPQLATTKEELEAPSLEPTWDEKRREEIFHAYLLSKDDSLLREPPLMNFRRDRDTIVIARMLEGRYQGVWKGGSMADKGPPLDFKRDLFVYGPCPHLQDKEEGKAACGIYDVRPKMCSTFPFDGYGFLADGATWRGCGYHLDPMFGLTLEEGKARLVVDSLVVDSWAQEG